MTAVSENQNEEDLRKKNKRTMWLTILTVVFVAIGLAWFLYWLFVGRFYVYTEDAYVHGNEVMLTPQVSASVKAIYADETDLVQQGQLVIALDPSDFEIHFEETKKLLAKTVRDVAALFQDMEAKQAQVVLRGAQLRLSELDYKHREPLVKTGAVSVEEFETYQTNVEVAQANLVFAEKEFEAAKALVAGTTVETHPRVQEVVWTLRRAYLDLIRCQILAPATGYIAKRVAQVGDRVNIGDTLLFIVPLDSIWIEANYKETQLGSVRIGQSASFTADIYGDAIEYHGTVLGFQPGSGNAFSLLPPENASGNWIKIIQRVPVRISVDLEQIKKFPLLLGLSIRMTVDIHDTEGKMLALAPTFEPLYSTSIYTCKMEEVTALDPLILDLIERNKYPH